MKSFKEIFEEWDSRGYKDNPIPLSKTHNQDKMNLDSLVSSVEKKTSGKDRHEREIDVDYYVRTGKLVATQDHLHKHGGGDPVFDHLRHPVIAEKNGVGHILDGHHRLAKDFGSKKTTKVHWVET